MLFSVCLPSRAQDTLVADLSRHLVAITTGFAGTDVLLFGATDGAPADVVAVVRGPARREVVRRKARTGGIWINVTHTNFDNVPAFYRVAATRPLSQIASQAVLARQQIGLDTLEMPIHNKDSETSDLAYRRALIRLKQDHGHFSEKVQPIAVLDGRLFRVEVHLPPNVPVGLYSVEIYLFRQGEVVNAQTTPLNVSKIGVGADVYEFAHRQAALYGIIAIALAASAGWLASVAFRRS
ncbi:MAG: TIGR02186 family protein [Rhodospirillales bacterium]|nr:TIGR02186 family protein [Rhodospirillales bacterium]